MAVHSLQAPLLPHRLRAEVAVCSRTVPVPGYRFRVERDDDSEVFSDSLQYEAGNPQVVSHIDTLARAHLELRLQMETVTCRDHSYYILL